jgi:oligoribonuclease
MTMYLWIDLETTGLDPDNDRIIEVGWFLSDSVEAITAPQSVLITPDKIAWELMQQDLFVQTMHTENDLLKDMEAFGTIMPEDAEDQILEDLARYSDEVMILAGASVHFDRGFIRNWMPRLDRRLIHRHLDVSTLRMFFDDAGFHSYGEKERPTVHRALQDVQDAHSLYRRYLELVNELEYSYKNRTDALDA